MSALAPAVSRTHARRPHWQHTQQSRRHLLQAAEGPSPEATSPGIGVPEPLESAARAMIQTDANENDTRWCSWPRAGTGNRALASEQRPANKNSSRDRPGSCSSSLPDLSTARRHQLCQVGKQLQRAGRSLITTSVTIKNRASRHSPNGHNVGPRQAADPPVDGHPVARPPRFNSVRGADASMSHRDGHRHTRCGHRESLPL